MPELQLMIDIEALVDRARGLWREVARGETRAHIELFAKVSLRSKVSRDLEGNVARLDRTHETGLAVRVMQSDRDHAGFASASGLSEEVVRWAVDTASSFGAQASIAAPGPLDSIPAERWDLDAEAQLPAEDALKSALMTRPSLEWVEAGTTLEVLIGVEGRLAARRRHRIWALDVDARLLAQRGFDRWEHLLDGACLEGPIGVRFNSENLSVLALAPDAASSVVAALVDYFHRPGEHHPTAAGPGWSVADQPERPDGLTGGSFDDAGFRAVSRVLATDGVWMGAIGGPGSFRRTSFRESPAEAATNLVMPSGENSAIPDGAMVARRCRVLRMSSEQWVLDLDFKDGNIPGQWERRWLRVGPRALLEACAARLGEVKVTPNGPIVPALLFEGLASNRGK